MSDDLKTIADLKFDPRNVRTHPQRNLDMLANSLQEVGAARSIVIDEEGTILAGNATIEMASQIGLENVKIVDTDGSTIIAVRRSDLTPEQKQRLALFDNRVSELAEWDLAGIMALQDEHEEILAGIWSDQEITDIASIALVPDLHTLEEMYPEGDPQAYWPTLEMKVPQEVYDTFQQALSNADGDQPWEKLDDLLNRLRGDLW